MSNITFGQFRVYIGDRLIRGITIDETPDGYVLRLTIKTGDERTLGMTRKVNTERTWARLDGVRAFLGDHAPQISEVRLRLMARQKQDDKG